MHQGSSGSVNTASTGVAARSDAPSPAAVLGGVAAYLVFLGLVFYVVMRWARRRRKAADEAIMAALTASGAQPLSAGPDGGYYRGTLREFALAGQRFLVRSYAVSRYYYRFNLAVAAPPVPAITILPESKVERFGKIIGMNREVQTGDPLFDDAAYVDSSEADTPVQQVFASPAVRDGVRSLLALGYKVQLTSGSLAAFQILAHGKPPELAQVTEVVALLGKLTAALPRLDPTSFRGTIPIQWARMSGLVLLWILPLVLAGMIDGFMHSPGARTLDGDNKSLFVGLGAFTTWLLYVLGLALWLRGRPYAFRMLLIAAAIGLLGLPASGVFLTLALNQGLDRSAAEEHVVAVLRTSNYKGDCRVSVSSWSDTAARVQLPVACKRLEQLPTGTVFPIRTHAGALGLTWVEPLQ